MFNFFKKKTTAPEPVKEDEPRLSSGFFSTDIKPPSALSQKQRLEKAIAMSIQIPVGDLTPVNADGTFAMDSDLQQAKIVNSNMGFLPMVQFEYYAAQGFIGWNVCAILSQNWLIDKACSMPGQDAVRHGYEVSVNDGSDVNPEIFDDMRKLDKRFKVKKQCTEFVKNMRIFGIRHALFVVEGVDYEAPFNIDGVRPGAYKGISQIDPYWMAPVLDGHAASAPASLGFYEPTWWMINGRKIHKSWFIIGRNGDEVPDILKPSYIYGGIPTTQKIFERVYAAERTANEAPMLAMTKRLTVLSTDTAAALADIPKFNEKMQLWTQLMNNFGIKVIGKDAEEIAQYDTGLADLDATIMTQYQLVAAASDVQATKFLGTSPKGFNATGEYEESSYREFLESIQENYLSPLVERHHQLCIKSYIAPKHGVFFNSEVKWLPVDSPTAKELAETNKIKAETDAILIDAGSIDGFDGRQRLINERDSGYEGIPDVVPGGVGDREAEQKKEMLALEKPEKEDPFAQDSGLGHFEPRDGTLNGARIITHQRYLDDVKVLEKIKNRDFVVNLTPEFVDEGKKYRMVIDGHHSLAAALTSGIEPIFIESVPRDVVFNPVTGQATDAKDTDQA